MGKWLNKALEHRHNGQGSNPPVEGGAAKDLGGVVVVLVGWLGQGEAAGAGAGRKGKGTRRPRQVRPVCGQSDQSRGRRACNHLKC